MQLYQYKTGTRAREREREREREKSIKIQKNKVPPTSPFHFAENDRRNRPKYSEVYAELWI